MIREVKENELKTIVNIYNSYIENFEFPIDEDFLKISLSDKNFKMFVYDDNRIIGFCGVYVYDSFAEIGPIGVDKRFLNKNIGTNLLKYVLNFLKTKKINKCIVRVFNKNLSAIKFFEKNDFMYEKNTENITYLVKFLR